MYQFEIPAGLCALRSRNVRCDGQKRHMSHRQILSARATNRSLPAWTHLWTKPLKARPRFGFGNWSNDSLLWQWPGCWVTSLLCC